MVLDYKANNAPRIVIVWQTIVNIILILATSIVYLIAMMIRNPHIILAVHFSMIKTAHLVFVYSVYEQIK
jgi:hypothetical protein